MNSKTALPIGLRQYGLPSLVDSVFIALFISQLFDGQSFLNYADTGAHIRFGEIILREWSIPNGDIFSFMIPPRGLIPHEWLAQAVMGLIHHFSGLTGIVLFFSLLISWIYAFLFKELYEKSNLVIAFAVMLLILPVSEIHWLARPHIFSLAGFMVFCSILDQYQFDKKNKLYLLPFLMALWVNLHGGFIMGFVALGIYGLGNLLLLAFHKDEERICYTKKVKSLGVALGVCLVAACMNPMGPEIFKVPFRVITEETLSKNFAEFLSPNFQEMRTFEVLIFLILLVFSFSRRPPNLFEWGLFLTTAHMALTSVRHVPFFCLTAAPILARQLEGLWKDRQNKGGAIKYLGKKINEISKLDQKAIGCVWPFLSILGVLFLIHEGKLQYDFDQKSEPKAAVQFLKERDIPGHSFGSPQLGDWLIYELWPQYKVFIHTLVNFIDRTDGPFQSSVQARKDYLKVTHIQPGWKEVLKKYDINWIFDYVNTPLSVLLLSQPDWRLIYADEAANIFVRNTPENQDLIRKYPDVRPVLAPTIT